MAQPRILTFNFHEPYLCLMAKTGLALDVAHYNSGFLAREWRRDFREPPANLTLLDEHAWRPRLDAGEYDVVIAQNENNAVDILRAPGAKLLLCHNRRSYLQTTASVTQGDPVESYARLLDALREEYEFIFISESKRDDYGIDGRVILPGIDVDEWGPYRGEEPAVLRVGNTLRERNRMFDVDFQERVLEGIANRVCGENPDMPGSVPAKSHDELRELYCRYRCMLHVTREEFEDGYNLSMLEAMASGMPVVSLANATSPITNGVDGFVSHDADELRARIGTLFQDLDLSREIGAAGRETVATKFPLERFVEGWREAILEAAERGPRRGRARRKLREKQRILLQYVAGPFTTGRYIEFAAREAHEVMTAGFRLPEHMLQQWGFPEPFPGYSAHDVDLPFRISYSEMLEKLPKEFDPDFLIYVDASDKEIDPSIDALPFPKVAYFIDTHVQLEPRLRLAQHFDVVFLAQSAQMEAFRARGVKEVHWLPLACWPPLHDLPERERTLDFAYVGSLNPAEGPRRHELVKRLQARFPNHLVGKRFPKEMAETYARAKIVVNMAHNLDVNMRVFEAMAAGALLITDHAEGLEALFTDREHLVIYRNDEEIFDLIAYYLEDDKERARIADAGRREVLEKHTYQHRLAELVRVSQEAFERQQLFDADGAPKSRAYYQCPRRELLPHIPLHTRRVLDIGCGAGALGLVLKEECGVKEVYGIEIVPAAYNAAKQVLDNVMLGNIEEMDLPYPDRHFDCIICADVLEHLVDPVAALRKLERVLADDGSIVISIPNIQYHEIINMLSNGSWRYLEAGLMDSTHLRFFTKSTVRRMIEQAGLEVGRLMPLNIRPESYVPLEPDGSLKMGKVRVENLTAEEHERFRVYQWAAVACKPNVDRLAYARDALAQGNHEAALLLAESAVGVPEHDRLRIMARALAKQGRVVEAESHYLNALELQDDPAVAGELGIVYVAMNRGDEAKALLERALAANGDNDRARGARGLLAFVEGDYAVALEHMQAALEASYEHRALIPHLAEAARLAGKLEQAEPTLRAYAEFYPGDVNVALVHAEVLGALGRVAEMRERLETVAMFSPDDQRVAAMLADLVQP